MPITIKQGLMKYKNGQNEYIGINTVGETASAQQISNINQAGTTQVSAINTKGQEVLASIPSDYTALSDEVSELNDAVNNLEKGAYSENVFGVINKTVTNRYYIAQATGEPTATNNTNLKVVTIANNGYRFVRVKTFLADANSAAVAFYSSETIGASSFISGIRGTAGTNTYTAEIPENCVTIGFTENIVNGDMEIYLLASDIFLFSYDDIKSIPALAEATKSVSSVDIMPHLPYSTKQYILYTTGELRSTNNTALRVYSLKNEGYLSIRAKLYAADANSAAIAFYSTDTISTDGYISSASVRCSAGWHEYSTEVPASCTLIAFTYRSDNAEQTPYIKYTISNEVNPYSDATNNIKPHDVVRSINHRGWYSAPENTIPAYKASKQNGFSIVECDVRFTSDGIPVLLHDATINRTARNADGTTISETISIGSITYSEALEYDFGIYKNAQYAGTKSKVATFAQGQTCPQAPQGN